ncbi:MAG: hypothetical protein KDD64_14905 [Bdellovibrionales bacterium]|nr:hypothetical protein [Bdellovibrionales bacterium]
MINNFQKVSQFGAYLSEVAAIIAILCVVMIPSLSLFGSSLLNPPADVTYAFSGGSVTSGIEETAAAVVVPPCNIAPQPLGVLGSTNTPCGNTSSSNPVQGGTVSVTPFNPVFSGSQSG